MALESWSVVLHHWIVDTNGVPEEDQDSTDQLILGTTVEILVQECNGGVCCYMQIGSICRRLFSITIALSTNVWKLAYTTVISCGWSPSFSSFKKRLCFLASLSTSLGA